MSFIVPYSLFTKEKIDLVAKFLQFTPTRDDEDDKYIDLKIPIQFFKKVGDQVHLPYTFTKKLFKDEFDKKLLTLPTFKERDFQFQGSLLDHQKSVFKQSIETLEDKKGLFLVLYTAYGKTVMACAISCYFRLRTLVIMSMSVLPKQFQQTYKEFSNANTLLIESGKKFEITENTDVVICTVGMLKHISPEIMKTFGVLIIDEVNLIATRTRILPLLYVYPLYIVGLTGTLKRPDGAEDMLYSMIGTSQIVVKSEKLYDVVKVETTICPVMQFNRYTKKMEWNIFVDSLIKNETRTKIICSLIENNIHQKGLLLTDRKELIFNIENILKEKGIKYGVMHGDMKSFEESPILLGTISKLGIGFDEKAFSKNFSGIRMQILYLAFTTKQKWLLTQAIGRVLRTTYKPTIFDIVDNSNILEKHYKIRKEYYDECNADIKIIRADISKYSK